MEILNFGSLKTSSYQAALAILELCVDHAAIQYRSTFPLPPQHRHYRYTPPYPALPKLWKQTLGARFISFNSPILSKGC